MSKLFKVKMKKDKAKKNKKRKRDKKSERAPAAKVAALLQGLSEIKEDEQAVVFSQYTSFLNIVQETLRKRGYTTSRIDGSMSANRRMESQQLFKRGGTRVMLISLKAGGVGLNLTSANHVFMMDMWWNQACEEQAWDRVYRLGQTKPVRIVRYITNDSIEEGFLKLQASKNTIGKGAMQKLKKKDLKRLRNLQVKILFGLEEEQPGDESEISDDDDDDDVDEKNDDDDSDFIVEEADEDFSGSSSSSGSEEEEDEEDVV